MSCFRPWEGIWTLLKNRISPTLRLLLSFKPSLLLSLTRCWNKILQRFGIIYYASLYVNGVRSYKTNHHPAGLVTKPILKIILYVMIFSVHEGNLILSWKGSRKKLHFSMYCSSNPPPQKKKKKNFLNYSPISHCVGEMGSDSS